MSSGKTLRSSILFGLALGAWACATPVAPTGGPRDTTPPILMATEPARNTVNFASNRITLTFSEKVDEASFQQALSFTPDISVPPEIEWGGTSVDVILRTPLRDSTTYILTIDKQLKDRRGVSLNQPITVAFATGATIDQGFIGGRVVEASSNNALDGLDVFAFETRRVDSTGSGQWSVIGLNPSYRTQTDSEGRFTFSNLPQRPFAVVAVEDRNRNRSIDSTEVFALPWWGATRPDSASVAMAGGTAPGSRAVVDTWYLRRPDILPPALTLVQALSSSRLEIRFSEPVRLDTLLPNEWAVEDTLQRDRRRAIAVYQPPGEPARVMLVLDDLPEGAYRLVETGAVRDSAGNLAALLAPPPLLTSRGEADTLRVRFVGFKPARLPTESVTDLGSGTMPSVTFNQYLTPDELRELVTATVKSDDSTETDRRHIDFAAADGTTWRMSYAPPVERGDTLLLEVTGVTPPDTSYSAEFAFLDDASTGSVTGFVEADEPVILELRNTTAGLDQFRVEADSSGMFAFRGMLKGQYSLRAFEDRDADGLWTSGSLVPFQFPEPLMWYPDEIEVRKGWEEAVDTLRFNR